MITTQQKAPTAEAAQAVTFDQGSKVATWIYRQRSLLLGTLSVVIVLAAWQICASQDIVDQTFSSSPYKVGKAFGDLVSTGNLWDIISPTMTALGWGLLFAIGAGVPFGLLIGRSKVLYYLTQPIINILYSVPYVTFLPLLIFWFGITLESRVLIVVWSAIMPIIINTRAGGRALDRDYQRVANAFCAPRLKAFYKVALPATVPYILAGVRLAIAHGLIGTIVAEFFLGSTGIGFYIQTQTSLLDMDHAIAAIAIIVLIAFILNWIVTWIEARFAHWSG